MASPVVAGLTKGGLTAAGTSVPVTLPGSGAAAHEWLIIMSVGSTAATVNALTDWAELLDENAAIGLKVLRYTGAGVPANPTFTTSASTRTVWIAYRITGADKTVTPQIGTTSTGTSATPDPPASATPPASNDYLFIAFAGMAGEEADDDTWANTPPTNYTPTPPRQKAGGTTGTNIGGLILSAERQLTTGVAENPGTFGVDVSAAWRAQTITVHPLTSTPHTHSQPDSIAGTDTSSVRTGKTQPDAAAATDSFAKTWAAVRPQNDAASVADTVAKAATSTVADTAGVTDAVTSVRGLRLVIADALAASDSLAKNAGKTVSDTAGATDAVAKAAAKPLADGLGGTDAPARVHAAIRAIADSGNWTDAAQPEASGASNWTHSVNDSLTSTDTAATVAAIVLQVNDAASAADALAAAARVALADTLAGADTISRAWASVLGMADGLALADAVTTPSVAFTYGAAEVWTYGPFEGWQYVGGTAFAYTGGTAYNYGG